MVLSVARLGLADGDADALDRLCEHPVRRVRQIACQWASQFYENLGDLSARSGARRALAGAHRRPATDRGRRPWSAPSWPA